MNVGITRIKIRIGHREVEMTIEEAKRLNEELNKLFPPPTIVTIPAPPQPLPAWPLQPHVDSPWVGDPQSPTWPPSWQVTCCNQLCISV